MRLKSLIPVSAHHLFRYPISAITISKYKNFINIIQLIFCVIEPYGQKLRRFLNDFLSLYYSVKTLFLVFLYISQRTYSMELILKSDNQESLAKIMTLAKKLNVVIEKKDANSHDTTKDALKNRILNFKAKEVSSFGHAGRWERDQREDRYLPLS